MSSPQKPIIIFLFPIFLFVWLDGSLSLESQSTSDSSFFLAYGHLMKIHPEELTLSLLYDFDPAAPTVGISPDGLYWARIGDRTLAAYNPNTGKIVANVMLPHRPYNHIITPEGKAYVTHHTLTNEKFWISIIDTNTKEFKGIIKNISGLRTSMAIGDDSAYLATIGVEKEDYLYLYQINSRDDRIEEIYRVQKTGYHWKISVLDGYLYMCRICKPELQADPIIEVMDLEKKTIVKTIPPSRLKGIRRIIEKVTFLGNQGFFPCRLTNGSYGIAVFNASLGEVTEVLNVRGQVYRIIGLKDDVLFYVDNPAQQGEKGVSLYFYSLHKRKEVKNINITEFLQKNQYLKRGIT